MKIVTYLLGALLAAALGAAALFYFTTFKPLSSDYVRMKAGMSDLDKAKAELKKCKDKEDQHAKETAWIAPAVAALSADLADEIKAGKAEVVAAGTMVVINIAEDALYTPESKTFAKDTQTRMKLVGMLKRDELKGKDLYVGNVTESVAPRGKGRKKVPGKDALSLASERSYELVKFLVGKDVPAESIAAVAYTAKVSDRGYKIRNKKTMIIAATCPAAAAPAAAPAPAAQTKAAPAAKPAAGAAPQTQPKSIPIKRN